MRARRHLPTAGLATRALALATACLLLLGSAGVAVAAATPPAGPPYPAPATGQRVYDYAHIFSEETIAKAEAIIHGIETRTRAQVAVFTQVKPESDDLDKADADAIALMDQWGVGRKGFDDGLVIMFDMQPNLLHGQVSLYAGKGYQSAFLSDSERQDIFDNDMKPLLKVGDMDGGLLAALRKIDANATSDHAQVLQRARQLDAVLVVLALLLGSLLAGGAVWAWIRHGRDPVYLDDASIYLPAPPTGLTPAMATLILNDRTSDRTVSAALVGLAVGGSIAFRATKPHKDDDPGDITAGIDFVRDNPSLQPPEKQLLRVISKHADKDDGSIAHRRLCHLIPAFDTLKADLEKASVSMGWMANRPSTVVAHWRFRGSMELTLAVFLFFLLLPWPIDAIFSLAVGLTVAGVVTLALAPSMPARTTQGAMLYAMLSAYKRSLAMTLRQSRSMEAVVAARAVPWITTPDQAMAWGVAFGLEDELQAVLKASLAGPDEDAGSDAAAASTSAWRPSWWLAPATSGGSHFSGSHGGSGSPAGLFSSSAIPNPGSIIAALGTITSASSPYSSGGGSSSSSSSSFSSSSFGGGSSGGGGGAGGGF